MHYPRVKRRVPKPADTQGVYADLDDLIRLQYKARGFSFLPKQPVHSILTGRHASRLRGRGLNFEELRGYLPGDDIRNIDWKVTARLREPHVRVYTEEKDRPVLLLIDQRMSMFFGSQRAMKSVTAAETAALAAWRVVDSGDRVGAIVFNDHDAIEITPHRSEARVMQILRTAVKMNHQLAAKTDEGEPAPETNRQMLNLALSKAQKLAKHDFLVILISDCCGADHETERYGTLLCQHNDMITGFIYDPLEADMMDAGRSVVSEGNQQLEIDSSDNQLRQAFHQQFNERLEQAKKFARQRAIPLLPISTAEDVATQIRQLLSQGTRGGRQ